MAYSEDNRTTIDRAKLAVIEYVKENSKCNKQKVVEYCKNEGIASRVTVMNAIAELQTNRILNVDKERRNSKHYKLTVDADSLLVILPLELDKIFIQFQDFVDTLNKLSQNEDEIHNRVKNSIYGDYINELHYDRIRQSLTFLPYVVIDIINDVFTFSFIFIWSKKIDDQNQFSKLYSIYFENISRLYSYLSKKLFDNIPADNVFPSRTYPLYENYLKSKKHNNFTKICYLAYLCTMFGIEDNLFKVLDLLWIKNIESVSLMYKNELENVILYKMEYERRTHSAPKLYPDISQLKTTNKHREYNNDILNKIHDGINYFILMEKGLELDNIIPPFKMSRVY